MVRCIHECEVPGWMQVELRGQSGKVPANFLCAIPQYSVGIEGLALSDFRKEGNNGQYLEFKKGEKLEVLERSADGWNVGIRNERLGLFPAGYLEYDKISDMSDIENVSECDGYKEGC